MVEGAPLLREYAVIPHRGFESLPLRQSFPKSLLYRNIEHVAQQAKILSGGFLNAEHDCPASINAES